MSEDREDKLNEIARRLETVRSNLWPDNYASGGVVTILAEAVADLTRIVAEISGVTIEPDEERITWR